MILVILIALIIATGCYIVLTYNTLINLIEATRNDQKQIDIQLDRRYKIFESLINVVKKSMDYEQTTLKEIISLRTQAESAKSQGDYATRIAAENQISDIASKLNIVFEQYPTLKANENTLQLQEEIANTENKLAYAKQSYNDSIEHYNAAKKSYIASIVVKQFKDNLDFDFPYWQISQEKIAEQENYTIKL